MERPMAMLRIGDWQVNPARRIPFTRLSRRCAACWAVGPDPRDNVPVAGFEATTIVKRTDFGLGLYVAPVSDEIRIHITCEAIEARAYAQRL